LDKPEYVVPQEGNSGNYNNTTTTDAEVPTKTTSGGIPIEELIKDPKPAMVELLLSTLFSMVDMIMVGRISYQALTAVGLTNHPTMLALAVFQALNVGSTALVARFIGSGDIKNAKATVRQSMVLVTILGIVVSIAGYLLSPAIITFMRAEPDVYPMSVSYLQIVSLGWLFTTISLNVGAILRGSGDTMTPMRYNLLSNLLNVVGNYVLIFGKFPLHCAVGLLLFLLFVPYSTRTATLVCAFNQYWLTLSHGAVPAKAGAGVLLPCRSRVGNGCLCGTPNSNQYLFLDFYARPGFWYGSYHHGGAELGC